MQRKEVFMEPKKIYCPECGRKLASWDGKSTVDVIVNCKKCKKRIIYRVDTGKTEIKKLPKRSTSSGITYR